MCHKFNFFDLGKILEQDYLTLTWCLQNRLLSMDKICPACKLHTKKDIPMKFNPKKDNCFGTFTCNKIRNHRNKKSCDISALKGTCFENAHISIQTALILTFCFVKKLPYQFTIEQTSWRDNSAAQASSSTVADWFAYCREVCMEALEIEYVEQGKIGGISKNC